MNNSKLTIDFIRDIIVKELSDLDEDRVFMANQKFVIPPVEGLFIVVAYKGSPRTLSSRNYTTDVAGTFTEYQDINTQEDLALSLFSKNMDAIKRKEEVMMSLFSVYSQQIQETNGFKIFRNMRISDVSAVEGAAVINRVDIDLIVHAWYQKVKTTDYMNPKDAYISVNDGLPNLTRTVDVSEQ